MNDHLNCIVKAIDVARTHYSRIGATNGCFDVIHAGHVDYLQQLKRHCDYLVVGINDDASVRALKGDGRPIHELRHRMLVVAELRSVDFVCHFSGPTATEFLDAVKPDVWAKSGGWTLDTLNQDEVHAVKAHGGEIVIIDETPGLSTTDILKKL